MCKDCGCGLPDESGIGVSAHHHEHEHGHKHSHEHAHGDERHTHEHDHDHPHDHDNHEHSHDHDHEHDPDHEHDHDHDHEHEHPGHTHGSGRHTVELRQAILAQNDRLAERNRGFFRAKGLLALNVLSSPGSGKTTLLQSTLKALRTRLKTAVIVGDLATDNDAQRLRESGAPVVQVTTGTVCHLDAEMTAKALHQLNLDGMELLVIENVGNLVCPASYDLGEDMRVVLLSVTEGEDKPLKYPPVFQAADAVIISKMDLSEPCGFDRNLALGNIRRVAPKAKIFELSAKTGQGMQPWVEFLVERREAAKARDPLEL